jgi:GlpG protein
MSIPLLKFSDEKPAQLLLAYFKKKGIQADVQRKLEEAKPENVDSAPEQIKPPHYVYELSIIHEQDTEQAITIAKEFLAAPGAAKYQEAAWDMGESSSSSESILGDFNLISLQHWQKHVFTHFVGALCVLIYLFQYLGYSEPIFSALRIQYFAELSQNHEWWRLIGPNFMHGSLMHVVMNLFWWWLLASKFERTFGTSSLVMLFVVSSLASNVAQLLYTGPNFLGLSGVVYALFGFTWWISWLRPKWGLSLPKGIIVFMLVWLVIGYADIFFVSFANEAHTFGLISGCLLALLLHQLTASFGNKKGS